MWQFLYLNDQCYTITFLLLLAGVALKYAKVEALRLLAVMNVFRAIAGILALFVFVKEIPTSTSEEVERFAFISRISGPYWLSFWFTLLGTSLLPQLFWYKQYRKSLTISLLVAVIPIIDKVIVYVITFFRGYLPFGWSMNYDSGNKVTDLFLYIGLITATHWITKRIDKKNYA